MDLTKITLSGFFCLCLLVGPLKGWCEETGVVFNPNTYYDIYFKTDEKDGFVMRRVKVVKAEMFSGEKMLVVQGARPKGDNANEGYVFLNNVSMIVPSDSFNIKPVGE